jgi:hypothetical protein
MTSSETHIVPETARSQDSVARNLRNLEKVRAIFSALAKYINTKTIYTSNNPNVKKFANALYEAVRSYFEDEKELTLTVEQYQLRWRDQSVYDNTNKTDSIAFLLYKDGVGEIIFQSSLKPDELELFVDIIQNEICNPSAHLDIVGKLWQSQFANIFYRVFDESAEGASGDGKGSGGASREQPLIVNDHPHVPDGDSGGGNSSAQRDENLESLGTFLRDLIEQAHPDATAVQKEEQLQNILESFFTASSEELKLWKSEYSALMERDRLFWLFNIMLDFTQEHSMPSVIRDILDIIERLVRYMKEEAHIPTLIALLDIQRNMARSKAVAPDFQSLPGRIKEELTNNTFLLALGKTTPKSSRNVHDIVRYFQMVGTDAIPGLCELLASSKDLSIHKEACDVLIDVTGDGLLTIINGLNIDNPFEARDAVYLLPRGVKNEIPPIVRRLVTSSDLHVREQVIEYLPCVGNEEAALMLAGLLEDQDAGIRMKTLSAIEEFKNPMLINKVTALCFSEDNTSRSTDEMERLFKTVGKLAGESSLPAIGQMIKRKGWMPFGRGRDKQSKLLAITALRYIPGAESLNLLRELANDGDNLVKTKALFMLRQIEETDNARAAEHVPV